MNYALLYYSRFGAGGPPGLNLGTGLLGAPPPHINRIPEPKGHGDMDIDQSDEVELVNEVKTFMHRLNLHIAHT